MILELAFGYILGFGRHVSPRRRPVPMIPINGSLFWRTWVIVVAVASIVAGLTVAVHSFASNDPGWTCYGEAPGGQMNETFHGGRCAELVGQPLFGMSLIGLGIGLAFRTKAGGDAE